MRREQQGQTFHAAKKWRQRSAHRQETQVHQKTGDQNLQRRFVLCEGSEHSELRRSGINPCGHENNFFEGQTVALRRDAPRDRRRREGNPYRNRRFHALTKPDGERH